MRSICPTPRVPVLLRGVCYVHGAHVFISGAAILAAVAWGMSLDYLALVARRACVLGSHRTVAIEEKVLGRLPAPTHCINSNQRHAPVLSLKVFLVLVHQPEGEFRCGMYQTAYRVVLQDCRLWTPSWCSPSDLLQLNGIYRKRVYTLVWGPQFCTCHPEDTCSLPASGGQWDYLRVP